MRTAAEAFDIFDHIWCINLPAEGARWVRMQARFAGLGLAGRVQRFAATPTPADHRIGRALTHRRIVQDAAERGLRSVLVIEDGTLFHAEAAARMAAAAVELLRTPWNLCLLGTWRGTDHLLPMAGCAHLMQAGGRTFPDALAYAAGSYASVLAALPAGFTAMAARIAEGHTGIEDALLTIQDAVVVHPVAAAIPPFLPYQDPADQFGFVA